MGAGSIQVQFRRGTHQQVSSFLGAPGEITADMTYMRTVLNDGVTLGGWPQERANLTSVNDASYSVLPTDTVIMINNVSTTRTVTLVSALNYASGQKLHVVDGTGSAAAGKPINVVAHSSTETIAGSTTFAISAAFGHLTIVTNSGLGQGTIAAGWSIV